MCSLLFLPAADCHDQEKGKSFSGRFSLFFVWPVQTMWGLFYSGFSPWASTDPVLSQTALKIYFLPCFHVGKLANWQGGRERNFYLYMTRFFSGKIFLESILRKWILFKTGGIKTQLTLNTFIQEVRNKMEKWRSRVRKFGWGDIAIPIWRAEMTLGFKERGMWSIPVTPKVWYSIRGESFSGCPNIHALEWGGILYS